MNETMKKIYIAPNTEITETAISNIICTSLEVDNNGQDGIEGDVNADNDWNIWGEEEDF